MTTQLRVPHVRQHYRLTWGVNRQNARVPHASQSDRDAWDVTRPHSPSLLPTPYSLLLLFLLLTLPTHAQSPTVLKITLHDTIQPITAGYLQRGLAEAARIHASAVLISLGTPGGLLSSTREMVSAIDASPVPVIVYIEPSGSRAGSAGFFLLEASDVAAMAPGTNAGAAHPILEGATMDPILKEKIENDAVAFLRSYTTIRGRDVPAAEDAIRNSKSYSAGEALTLHLIDLIAPEEVSLLRSLDGRAIKRFSGTTETLHFAGAVIVPLPPSTRERLLSRLTNPDLAVFFLICGALLIYLEFNVPGTVVPGALGSLLFLLGVFGLNLLPVRHTAVLLLLFALALLILEAKFASHGVIALAGIACLVAGLATLVDAPIPELRVHSATAAALGIAFGAISFALAWLALRARRNKRLLGPDALLGSPAIALTALAPAGQLPVGQVEVRGEIWSATVVPNANLVPPGTPVTVDAIHGLTLLVSPSAVAT
jgi:membrane-bound serine protease (ClpP class)